jgi:hypothetical protein
MRFNMEYVQGYVWARMCLILINHRTFLGMLTQQTRNLYLTHAQMLIREEVYLAGILFGTRLNIW